MAIIDLFSILANIATILGVPIAILVYISEKKKERRDREYGTYTSLDDKYIEYLKMCMTYPELDLYEIENGRETQLTQDMKIKQYAMFDILVSLLERSYLLYSDQSSEIKRLQWAGWDDYIKGYIQRTTFQSLWKDRGQQFEVNFTRYINKLITEYEVRKISNQLEK